MIQNRIGSFNLLKLLNKNKINPLNIGQKCCLSSNRPNENELIRNDYLLVDDEIKYSTRPIVALESTIITHGLPYPTNLEMALEVENEIKAQGAQPATVAFLNGRIKVGLTREEIETVAKSCQNAIKLSRRDLTYVLANENRHSLIGGTTVSGTCIAAHAANIPIFCTGGLGGVHRDFIDSMDVSADLQELSKTPVAVVSSGIKSILDIEKTLEYLETLGVCVYTLSQDGTKDFPAFYCSKSGHEAPYNLRNEQEAARIIQTNLKTGLNMGLLIGVPIPSEHSADENLIESAIKESLLEASKLKIKGKKVTPFLLERISKITKGISLSSNLALIKNNAKVSAKIAIELQKLNLSENSGINDRKTSSKTQPLSVSERDTGKAQITLIGGINLDNTYKITDDKTLKLKGVTQPCEFYQSLGGVARNMTEALIRLGNKRSYLITALGNDMAGSFVREESHKIGFDTKTWLFVNKTIASTGSYGAVFDTHGELLLGCGDMRSHDLISPSLVEKHIEKLKNSDLCVIDADIPVETIRMVCNYCQTENIPIWFNPTDLRKATKIVDADSLSKITYMSPNLKELVVIFKAMLDIDKNLDSTYRNILKGLLNRYYSHHNLVENLEHLKMNDLKEILKYLLRFVPFIVLSRGSKDLIFGCAYDLPLDETSQLVTKKNHKNFNKQRETLQKSPTLFKFPIIELSHNEKLVNVTGAGDSCSSGIINGILKNYPISCSIYNGLLAAKYAVMCQANVSSDLDKINFEQLTMLSNHYKAKIKKISL